MITTLEPKPGRRFATSSAAVVPDVIVRKTGPGRPRFRDAQPDVAPMAAHLRELYANAPSSATRGSVSNSPLGGRLQEARWFIKNIQQRFEIILRVSTAIVERQPRLLPAWRVGDEALVLRRSPTNSACTSPPSRA